MTATKSSATISPPCALRLVSKPRRHIRPAVWPPTSKALRVRPRALCCVRNWRRLIAALEDSWAAHRMLMRGSWEVPARRVEGLRRASGKRLDEGLRKPPRRGSEDALKTGFLRRIWVISADIFSPVESPGGGASQGLSHRRSALSTPTPEKSKFIRCVATPGPVFRGRIDWFEVKTNRARVDFWAHG